MKKFLVVPIFFILFGLFFCANKANATSGSSVIINEFLSNGTEWVELFNTASFVIDLSGWHMQDHTGVDLSGVSTTTILSGSILANGFSLVNISGSKLNNGGDIITIFDKSNNKIDEVSYGSAIDAAIFAPASGESAYRTVDGGSIWSISSLPTPGTTNSPTDIPPLPPAESAPPATDPVIAADPQPTAPLASVTVSNEGPRSGSRHHAIGGGEVLGASTSIYGQQLLSIMMQLLNLLQTYQNSLR